MIIRSQTQRKSLQVGKTWQLTKGSFLITGLGLLLSLAKLQLPPDLVLLWDPTTRLRAEMASFPSGSRLLSCPSAEEEKQ